MERLLGNALDKSPSIGIIIATMKTLERSTVKAISEDMMTALQAVALKHGVHFSYKGGRFSSSNCLFKVEAAVITDGGTAETRERTAFKLQASYFQLKPEWLDKTFSFGGDDYTIIGLNVKAYKAPVLATQASNGKTYKFKADHVKMMMLAQNPSTPALTTPASTV